MIKDIKISNYKKFKTLEIPDFKQFNLITGRNNSGKSTLLEALSLLYKPTEACYINGIYIENFDRNSCLSFFNMLDTENPIQISTSENELDLTLKLQEKQGKNKGKKQNLYRNPAQNEAGFELEYEFLSGEIKKRRSVDINKESRLKYRYNEHTLLDLPEKLINVGSIYFDDYALLYKEIQNNGRENEVLQALNNTLGMDLKAIRVESGNIIKIDAGYEGLMPLYALGGGLTTLFRILLALYNTKGGIVTIDEIGNGFHPLVLKGVWAEILKLAKKFNIQVFASTHSAACLEAYNEACEELNIAQDSMKYHELG